jgi:alpha-L-rhamnosidase
MKHFKVKALAFFSMFALFQLASQHMTAKNALSVGQLQTEYRTNPIGLDAPSPRLSWIITSSQRGTVQTAYQISAAASEQELKKGKAMLWNSGKIASDQSTQVVYNGVMLQPSQRVYWQVTVWDNKGQTTTSPIAWFETGLLSTNNWAAKWIEPQIIEDPSKPYPAPFLRKSFSVDKTVKSARIYTTAKGLYLMSLNGQRISDNLFAPGWTSYNKRLQYQTYDVTALLTKGANAWGAILGDGWYRGPLVWQGKKNLYGSKSALLAQLNIEYTDGTTQTIITDGSWKATTGPILKSEIYDGEVYDAQKELTGWDLANYNDQSWSGCKEVTYDNSILAAQETVPVRITQTLKPVSKIITPKNELVYDFGQNLVGWIRFSLSGKKGQRIVIHHAEVLDKDGNFYTANLRPAKQEIIYTFKGDGVETFEPHFTYQGFRYIRISEYTDKTEAVNFTACVIHSDMAETGNFTCSDTLVNRLQKNIQWGLRGNFLDVPTDCPQRDERLGWTGDAQVFAPTACFNRNAAPFFTKWMKDLTVDQRADGSVPWVVPMVVEGGGGTGWSDGYGATGWADVATVIPWTVFKTYGDVQILHNQYPSMKKWVDYMIEHSGDRYIFDYGFHFGDWLAFAEYTSLKYNAPDFGYAGANTDKDLIATAYFYYSVGILEQTATILGKQVDAALYRQLRPKIKAAFQREFVTQTGRLTSNTQTAYVLALAFGIMPDEMRETAITRLKDDVLHFGHLTTGFLGTPLICQALTDNGYADIAYMLLFNKQYPGWLYPVTKGATTIWERWDGIKPDGTFQDVGMNSFNHYAYGAVGDWLYSRVAGLTQAEGSAGYKQIVIKPYINNGLTFAEADFESVYGKVSSRWETVNGKLKLLVTIPANTTAKIYFPSTNTASITESGKAITKTTDAKFIETTGGYSVFAVGSGVYVFEGELN